MEDVSFYDLNFYNLTTVYLYMNAYQYIEVNVSILNAFALNTRRLNRAEKQTSEAHDSRKGVRLVSGLTAAESRAKILKNIYTYI